MISEFLTKLGNTFLLFLFFQGGDDVSGATSQDG